LKAGVALAFEAAVAGGIPGHHAAMKVLASRS
jgi:homoserine dehydrogenase